MTPRTGLGWFKVFGFLLVAAAYTPFRSLLANIDKFPHPERLGMIIFAYLVLGLGWFLLLEKLGIRREASLSSSLALVLLLSSGGIISTSKSTAVGLMIAFALPLAVALLINRMPPDLGRFLSIGLVAFMMAGLILSWPSNGQAPSAVDETADSSLPPGLIEFPDVYLIVLDGFPGERAVRDIYDASVEFEVHDGITRNDAWSSYPLTIASVTSMLDMGYPLESGDVVDGPTSRRLARVMAGENRFTETLDENGYRITYVESGYSRSYCADIVDVCVESAFLDEGTHWVLAQSILGREIRQRTGSAFTWGALHTMDWLREHLESLAADGHRDLVFANVLAPHPPLFLDSECGFVYEYWRAGNSVYAGAEIVEERQKALIDQSECIAGFEDDMFESIPDDAVLVFVSDHGGDSLGQMSIADRQWDQADIVERLNVHFAARLPEQCDFGSVVHLNEVLRDLLWCLAGTEPSDPEVEDRMFTASRIDGTTDYALDELTHEEIGIVRAPGG